MKIDLSDAEWAYVFSLIKNDCVARKQSAHKYGSLPNREDLNRIEIGLGILEKITYANENKWNVMNKL